MDETADRSQTTIDRVRRSPGAWLYHYTTLETALVFILSTMTLRLGPFSDMRDPREYKRWWTSAVGFGGGNIDAFTRNYAEANQRVNGLREQFKLLSFTTDAEDPRDGNYDRGFARSRLWEAYAGRGTGVCLVLDREIATESIMAQLRELGRCEHGLVRYKSEPLHLPLTLSIGSDTDVNALADGIADKYMHDLFLTKNTEWESEREYRFVVRTAESRYEHVRIDDSLIAIILGPEAATGARWEAQWIARLAANERDLGLGLVEWHNNDPTLLGLRAEESEISVQRRTSGRGSSGSSRVD